jgi:hypothetical protein
VERNKKTGIQQTSPLDESHKPLTFANFKPVMLQASAKAVL